MIPKLYHISPSKGQRCGIASFADALSPALKVDNLEVISSVNEIKETAPLLVEHEYGIHSNLDWDKIGHTSNKKVVIQHAYSSLVKYRDINVYLFEAFDKIIFLSKRCKIEACNAHPRYVHKFEVIPHFSEELQHLPRAFPNKDNYTIGIHGFAFPRNGLMRLLNAYKGPASIYMLATISAFNHTAEMETGVYIDKMRRRIWQMEKGKEEIVKLDFNYYESKSEIINILRDNCDVLVHVTDAVPNYYNASGSIHVLLATGLPVFILQDSPFAEPFPTSVLNRMDTIQDIFDRNRLKVTTTEGGIRDYHKENSITTFADKVLSIIESIP